MTRRSRIWGEGMTKREAVRIAKAAKTLRAFCERRNCRKCEMFFSATKMPCALSLPTLAYDPTTILEMAGYGDDKEALEAIASQR